MLVENLILAVTQKKSSCHWVVFNLKSFILSTSGTLPISFSETIGTFHSSETFCYKTQKKASVNQFTDSPNSLGYP